MKKNPDGLMAAIVILFLMGVFVFAVGGFVAPMVFRHINPEAKVSFWDGGIMGIMWVIFGK